MSDRQATLTLILITAVPSACWIILNVRGPKSIAVTDRPLHFPSLLVPGGRWIVARRVGRTALPASHEFSAQ